MKLALDTGASRTTIPWDIAVAIGLKPVRGHDVVVHDLPQQSFVDGVLGLNFLDRFDLYLLFRQDAIDLQP